MLRINSGQYEILVSDEFDYDLNSADNLKSFDSIEKQREPQFQPSSKYGIQVKVNNQAKHSCLVLGDGGSSTVHRQSAAIRNGKLFVCCGDSILCFEIAGLKLDWRVQSDTASCFGIYSIDNGLLIHGELSITRLDFLGNIIWQFGGYDIFANSSGASSFRILQNQIELLDFSENTYRLDFDGKLLFSTLR